MKFEEIIEHDGVLVYKTRGVSMEPMLRQNRDLVVIRPCRHPLKKYDVPLYRRGKNYVLHRIIGRDEDGYLIRGDNTYTIERVPETAVIGVLTGFVRKGREISVNNGAYKVYSRLWHRIYPLRERLFRMRCFAVAILRRTGLLPLVKKLLGRV